MKSILRRRPSPALVIACIALFLSLGGVSYGVATGFIDSRELKDNTVRSRDVRNNTLRTFDIRNNEVRGFDVRNSSIQGRDVAFDTLTGDDISEEDLGKVPSATSADTAATAGSVGGVGAARILYQANQSAPFTEVLNLGGLRLEARCTSPGGDLEVQASTSVANSELDGPANGDADFDPGETVLVVDPNAINGQAQIAFAAAGGGVVTVHALTTEDMNGVRGSTDDCGFFGVAQAG